MLISDYIDLVKDLINLATQNGAGQETINNILDRKIRFHSTLTRPRLYREFVEGRFSMDEVIRIERKTDEHTISNKTFDFSVGTIRQLLNDGYIDASDALQKYMQERDQKRV